jgi:hypothetical protein
LLRRELAPFLTQISASGLTTLNRLELSKLEPTRYHKIDNTTFAIVPLLIASLILSFGDACGQLGLFLGLG